MKTLHQALPLLLLVGCAMGDDGLDPATDESALAHDQGTSSPPAGLARIAIAGEVNGSNQQAYWTGLFVADDLVLTSSSFNLAWRWLSPSGRYPTNPVNPTVTIDLGAGTPSARVTDVFRHTSLPFMILRLATPIEGASVGVNLATTSAAPPQSFLNCYDFSRYGGSVMPGSARVSAVSTQPMSNNQIPASSAVVGGSPFEPAPNFDDLGAICVGRDGIIYGMASSKPTVLWTVKDVAPWRDGLEHLSTVQRGYNYSGWFTNGSTGLCLDVPGFDYKATNMNQYACNTGRNQYFYEEGWYVWNAWLRLYVFTTRLVSAETGRCATAGASGVTQAPCDGSASQTWTFGANNSWANNGRCLTVNANGMGSGWQMGLTTCSTASPGPANQAFTTPILTFLY